MRATGDTSRPSLFHHSDLYVLGGFGVATIAFLPLDRHLATLIRDERLLANERMRDVAHTFRFFGGPGPFLIGGAMYTVGRVAHVPRLADVALHGTEAVIVGAAVSSVLKVALGRTRPYVSADKDPQSFGFLRGQRGRAYQSFPSGHSTAAFAAAAAVTTETSELWPRSTWFVAPVMYGGATLVGLSRMYDDSHWASDVAMGAAIGTFAGLKTVRFNHTREGTRVDRWLLGRAARAASHARVRSDPLGRATIEWSFSGPW